MLYSNSLNSYKWPTQSIFAVFSCYNLFIYWWAINACNIAWFTYFKPHERKPIFLKLLRFPFLALLTPKFVQALEIWELNSITFSWLLIIFIDLRTGSVFLATVLPFDIWICNRRKQRWENIEIPQRVHDLWSLSYIPQLFQTVKINVFSNSIISHDPANLLNSLFILLSVYLIYICLNVV